MPLYLLKIKPIEHFFFGVEKVGNLGNRKPYYLETTEFPQQTSILGLIRYTILLKEGKLGKNGTDSHKEINELIGENSFDAFPDTVRQYGKIKSISPVFIYNESIKSAYFVRALDWQYHFIKKRNNCRVSYGSEKKELDYIPFLTDYKAKEGIESYLISTNGDSIPLWFNSETGQGVLRKQTKAGNQKNPERFLDKSSTDEEKEVAKNEAYYMQEFLYMEKPYAFASIINIEIENMDQFETILPFGGERSSFAISFEPLKDSVSVDQYYCEMQPQNFDLKIELLSDAYVEQDLLNLTCFAICDTIGFRNLKTKTTTKNYNRISQDKTHNCAELSNHLQLLRRGSVLFFDSLDELRQAEEKLNNSNFTTIGYNKYRKFELKKIDNHDKI